MKKTALYLICIGVLILIAGMFYEVIFVGIPNQDPPNDLQLTYERNRQIAYWIRMTGLYIMIPGISILLIRLFSARKKQ